MEKSNPTSALISSASKSGCDEWLDMIFLVLDRLLSGVIIIDNGVTCLLKNSHFRRCFMNTFLVSLAVADILMAVFEMPGEMMFCTSCSQQSANIAGWSVLWGIFFFRQQNSICSPLPTTDTQLWWFLWRTMQKSTCRKSSRFFH